MNFLFRMVQTAEDEIRRSAWAESNRQEPLWPSLHSGATKEDLEATKHRVIHGLPKLPMAGWRW
jgi:hypothetical protein